MKTIFQKIFGNKSKRIVEKKIELTKTEQLLDTLANSISDIGYWNWWTTQLPEIIQLEFGGTQLYFEPTDKTKPPSSQIAIQFRNPKSISFLSREEHKNDIVENWSELLQNDKLEPPTFNNESFTFIDNIKISSIIEQAKTINTIHGYSPKNEKFLKENYKLAFWSGFYGFAVCAEEIKILTIEKEININEIPNLNGQWWGYWSKYWDLKNTKNALPKDYMCEITIPATQIHPTSS